jgi:uridine kinase
MNFYFDPRGFLFFVRTEYFTTKVIAHLGGKPYAAFEQKQLAFQAFPAVGYKDFKAANREVDECFIAAVQKLITAKGTPILLAIAGQTAAGKTEIVERLSEAFNAAGRQVTTIELDNFLTDRDYREAHGIDSEGKQALHFKLLKQALADITAGKKISIPRYDFVNATSSHDISGSLKPDGVPVEVEPADIIFMEGNFPFLLEEIVDLIGIKVVYLTDDPVRLKRKWKRDMDYRKKYSLNYFRNRYFKDQFIMALIAYIPQLEVCDLAVDTTGAAVWASAQTAAILDGR